MKTSTDFEKIAKKNKRKHQIKTMLLSTVLAILTIVLGYMGLDKLTSSHGEAIKDRYLLLSEIAYPNIDYSSWGFDSTSQFTGTFRSQRFKDIDGIKVPFESYQANYSLRPGIGGGSNQDSLTGGDDGKSLYTRQNGYKVPMFYNINYDYNEESHAKVTQDISLLSQMSGQAVEVAVTFDKPYTFEEIAELIPDDIAINWYWIGTKSDYDTSWLQLGDLFGMAHSTDQTNSYSKAKEWEEKAEKAIKKNRNADLSQIEADYPESVDEQTSLLNSYTFFEANLKEAIEKDYLGSSYSYTDSKGQDTELNTKKEVENYLKANSDGATAKFAGVILTGRAENFAQLQKADWIYASNIGQSVQIQPYHVLDK
ncbi:Sigma factor regulator N-terminal [Streptococcus henryi]|jgi:hypothetical protein|uniref:Sigma factor regulator N-terminal n=1 Tax=Streptococcus henryi TaxID=439219 RepID=A0A1G6BPZ0_9STRE|nr:anti sigma factor C-terminal domain-containing protein [Streptococcus henryi]SDB22683.1 Sigma factor regulator N-terminal [Streptococcus henryi]